MTGQPPASPNPSSSLRQRLTALHDPSGQVLAELLDGGRSRVPVPPADQREVWDRVDPATRAQLLAEARAELRRPAPVLRASDWARTFRDGVRTAYEDQARALRDRTALLVTAAVLVDERAPASAPPGTADHLDGAADCLVALLEAGTWCWAPHDRYTAARSEQLPDPDEPFLDLGAAETALLMAWTDHVLGARLETRLPGLRRRIRREVRLRVLDPFRQTRDWHWIGRDADAHNWNAWIHHAVVTCALLLTENPGEQAELVGLAVEGLDHYLAVLPDDGGIDEGVSYWWHGAGQLLEILDLLAAAGGGLLDARDLPILAHLARYPLSVHLGGPWYVNVGDAPAKLPDHQPWHLLYRWGRLLGDDAVRAHAADGGRAAKLVAHPRQGLGRAMAALVDSQWSAACSGRAATASPRGTGRCSDPQSWLPAQVWLPRVQLMVAREEAGTSRGLTVAAKAGHNGERHNHLDVGGFIVALDGRPVLVDVGKPTYTARSFGPARYDAWPLQSQWHNLPQPGGAQQQPGAQYRARNVSAELSSAGAVFSADLETAYPPGAVTRWRRTVRLVRQEAGRPPYVVVEDAAGVPAAGVLLRHVTDGEIDLGDEALGSAVVRTDGGPALRLGWDPGLFTASVERRPLEDPQLRCCWSGALSRLTLRLRDHVPAGADLYARLRCEREP